MNRYYLLLFESLFLYLLISYNAIIMSVLLEMQILNPESKCAHMVDGGIITMSALFLDQQDDKAISHLRLDLRVVSDWCPSATCVLFVMAILKLPFQPPTKL